MAAVRAPSPVRGSAAIKTHWGNSIGGYNGGDYNNFAVGSGDNFTIDVDEYSAVGANDRESFSVGDTKPQA